jgi:DNA helicase II / ATP-dependent DNA helicase PcrA
MNVTETKQHFTHRPTGAVKRDTPLAQVADTINSTQIVPDSDHDAYYFRALEKKGICLNRAQIDAVRHFQGPLLTLAGAGSGKTSVLVCRTGYLIQHHKVAPQQILLVTFSTKAAGEMRERIADLPGLTPQDARRIEARTFHSFFLLILRKAGFNQEILSNERYKQIIIKGMLREMNLGDSYQPETLLALFSFHKMNMEELPARTDVDKEIVKLFQRFEDWKKKNNKLDFDDILVEAYNLISQSPGLLKNLQEQFRYIMVDEFQDTNLLQYELIKLIAQAHNHLCVVGDDDQTIYSFNGARNEFILNFNETFPNAKTVTLDINYRSTDAIVGLGNAVIKKNKHRKVKTLKASKKGTVAPQFSRPDTSDTEAEWIVQDIKEKIASGTHQWGDFAILHRTQSGNRAIFEQLSLEGIPFISYSMGEQIFYEHWTVKPVLDHLRLALNPRYFEAYEGVIPSLYINKDKGLAFIKSKEVQQTKKYPLIHLQSLPQIKDFQAKQVKERIMLIRNLKKMTALHAIKHIRNQFYDKYLEANDRQTATEHKESIKEMLDELEASAKRFDTVLAFVTFVDDMIKQQREMVTLKKGQGADVVSLMTIHRAKGLEFDTVYLIGASEGILPHQSALDAAKLDDKVTKFKNKREMAEQALEEERRLAYVAITRAKNDLFISSPANYRGKKAEISRFLLEAYGKEEMPIVAPSQTNPHHRGQNGQRTVLAWICEGEACNGWQKITTYEEIKLKEKQCPICKGQMKQGSKAV